MKIGGVNYNIGGNINITNSSFINNMALNGSVNYNTNSATLNIIQSEFKDNTANDKGGINYNNKSYMNITDSKFTNNTGVVGGINFNNNSYVNITNVNFTNNKARSNSSINYNENTNITILDSNFTNNTSGPVGINSNVNTNITLQNLIFTNITFSGYGMEKSVNSTQIVQNVTYINTISSGTGGVFEASDSTIIMDNVIFNQTSSSGPGGVFNITNTTVNATNVNFTDCNASNGGVFNTLNSRINLTNVNFTRCNTTGGNGGVIASTNSNITISNANFNTTYARSTGGAFSIRNTNLNITNANFTNTKAGSPGGIVDFTSSNVSIIDSNINDTSAMMGSIFYSGTSNNLTIKSTNITNTVATSAPGAVGYLSGNDNIIVENTLINETISTNVGGLFYIGGSSNILKIKSSNITKTQINANGPGAIYLGGNSNLIIEDSQFSSNTAAGIGCVIYNSQGNVEIRNSNFTDNNQTTENLMGGVIYNDKGQLNIENSIFTNTLNQNNTIYSNADITLINVTLNNTITTPKAYEENTYYTPIQVDTLSENEDITITVDNQIFTTNKNATTNITSFNYTFSTSGDKTIKMSYPTYADSNINLLMDNVEAVDIIEIQPVSDIRVFDKITVDVTLKKADGTLFTDELPVAFKIGDKIYKNTTITGGQTTQEIDTSTLPVGDYDVVVIVGVENQTQFTIIKRDIEDKTITIDEIKTFENTTIDLTINDEMGTQLIGSIPVEVLLNGTSVLNTTIVDGVLKDTIPTDTLAGGEYDVEFKIPESDNYNAKTFTTKLNILKRGVIVDITTNADPVKPLDNVTVTITVTDENTAQSVRNGNVVLSFDEHGEIATLELTDGRATYTYTIPTDVIIFEFLPYHFEAVYEENDYYTTGSNKIEVNLEKLDIEDKTITIDEIKTFENTIIDLTINDEKGNTLIGSIPVEVLLNGTSVLNTTIVDGVLKDTIPTDTLVAGEYDVEFRIEETDIYNAKTFTTKLNILKRDVIVDITSDVSEIKPLHNITFTITVTDENTTQPVKEGQVVLKFDNNEITTLDLKDGKATYTYTIPSNVIVIPFMPYTVEADYITNNYYNKASNNLPVDVIKMDIADTTVVLDDTRVFE